MRNSLSKTSMIQLVFFLFRIKKRFHWWNDESYLRIAGFEFSLHFESDLFLFIICLLYFIFTELVQNTKRYYFEYYMVRIASKF